MSETDRTKFIGASDIPAILGIGPFKTPLQLWAEKTGKVPPPDLSDNEPVYWGKTLERIVSKEFEKRNEGMKLMAYKRRFVSKRYPFLSCELDNIVVGTDIIVEVKTVHANSLKNWKDADQIPDYVVVQVMFQLGISGRQTAYVACLIGGQKYIQKKIEFDADFFRSIEEKAVSFWKMVEEETPPTAVLGDDEALLALHPKSNDQLQALQEFEVQIARCQELDAHIKEMEKEQGEIKTKLKEAIGDNLGIQTEKYKVLWTPYATTKVDTDALKKAGIYEAYCKQIETRRLTIKLNKLEK